MKRLTGIVAATPTPLHNNGTVQLERIPELVEFLLAEGIDGLYVLGSTGEGVSMTTAERRITAEAFIQAVAGRRPVVVQVGHNSPREARELAAHAASVGANAVSATPPSYFRLGAVDALIECIAEIAAGAARLPFYYYHIPSVTGVQVDMPDFLSRAGDMIPNLAGVKFTSPAIWEYQTCVELDQGRFDCLYGHDEMLLPALAVGARGAVGSTYNFAAPLYKSIVAAFEQSDFATARARQARANAMIRILLRRGGLPAIKAAMGLVGVDCGPVRAPLVPLTAQELDELRNELTAIGFLEAQSAGIRC